MNRKRSSDLVVELAVLISPESGDFVLAAQQPSSPAWKLHDSFSQEFMGVQVLV